LSDLYGRKPFFLLAITLFIVGSAACGTATSMYELAAYRAFQGLGAGGLFSLALAIIGDVVSARERARYQGYFLAVFGTSSVLGPIGLVLFVFAERRVGDDALIPLRFFRNEIFSLGSVISIVIGMGMFGGIVSLPLYLQIVKGATPTKAGLLLVPLTLGIMLGSVISGQVISRTGRYKIFPVVGSALMVLGLLLFSRVGADTPLWQTSVVMLIFGLGLGGNMQPITLAIQNAMPPQDIGVATSSATFFRQMGGTLGTAVFLSILFSSVSSRIAAAFREIAPMPDFQAALRDPAVLANPVN